MFNFPAGFAPKPARKVTDAPDRWRHGTSARSTENVLPGPPAGANLWAVFTFLRFRRPVAAPSRWAAAGVSILLFSISPGAQPADPAQSPRNAGGSGLARRPNPKLADRTPSGLTLRPFANHRKLGAVYHTVSVRALPLSATLPGLQASPTSLAGYAVARIPMDAASNGALGPVIVAGQWQLPWTSLVDAPTLARWSTAQGGPLKLEEFPAVAFTIRNAVDTKLIARDESTSSYMCTLVADISINGITTERVIQRTIVSFMRGTASDPTIKGEQLSIRARWQIRLSDFFSSLPGVPSLPMVDVNADLLMSTVSPEAQRDDAAPAPQESSPDSEAPKPSAPASTEPSRPNDPPSEPPSTPK